MKIKKLFTLLFATLFVTLFATLTSMAQGLDTLITDTPTNETVARTYTIWFASSGMFVMAVIWLSGKLIQLINPNMSSSAKQYISWGTGALLGLVGGLFHLGVFELLNIPNSIIAGLVFSGFANVIFNTGSFDATSKAKV